MQWEYCVKVISARYDAETKLETLGLEGWEAVSVWKENSLDTYVLLKRPKSK
jgi:hypothetical protein